MSSETAFRYSEIYSQFGLEEMIKEGNERIVKLQREREDVGKSWTKLHVQGHRKRVDQEITSQRDQIKMLEEALKLRRSEGLH